MAEAIVAFRHHIAGETLSVELVAGTPKAGAYAETVELDGQQVTLAVRRVMRNV